MNFRCDFHVDEELVDVYKRLVEAETQPKHLRHNLLALKEQIAALRELMDRVNALQVSDALVARYATRDDRYLNVQRQVDAAQRVLEEMKQNLREFNKDYAGVMDALRGAFNEIRRHLGPQPKTRATTEDVQEMLRKAEQTVQSRQRDAAIQLQRVTVVVHEQLQQQLKQRKKEVNETFNGLEGEILEFEASVEELNGVIVNEGAKLSAFAADMKQEITSHCARFNEGLVAGPVAPVTEDLVPDLFQRDPEFLPNLLRLLTGSVPDLHFDLNPVETRCGQAEQLAPYQRALSVLGNFRLRDWRQLILWSPGTGKSCLLALVIQRLILSLVLALINGTNTQGFFPQLPVGIVVFVHTPGDLHKYKDAKPGTFCELAGWSDLVDVVIDAQDDVVVSRFVSKRDGQAIAVLRTQKFSVKAKGVSKELRDVFPTKEGLPREGGMILVDEAHYLFNPKEISAGVNHAALYLEEMLRLQGVKMGFLTATPASNSANFEDIVRMVAFCHANELPPDATKFLFGLTETDIIKRWDPVDKRRDLLFDMLFQRVGSLREEEEEGEEEKGEAAEAASPHEYANVVWKPGVKDEFLRVSEKHVSFVTLEHDRGVYPVHRVTPQLKQIAATAPADALPVKISATLTFNGPAGFEWAGQKPATALPYLLVKVRYAKGDQINKRALKKKTHKIGTFFKKTKELPWPEKWTAIEQFISKVRAGNKFFIFSPSKSWHYAGFKDFNPLVLEDKLGLKKMVFSDATMRLYSEKAPAGLEEAEAFERTRLKRFVDAAYDEMREEKERYIELDSGIIKGGKGKTKDTEYFRKLLAVYNDPRNATGRWIRVVVGDNYAREGLDIFDTRYTILIEPPLSGSSLRQIEARTSRFCGFRATSKLTIDWWTTPVIFVATTPTASTTWELDQMKLIDQDSGSPAGLLEQALHEAAFDCKLFRTLNQVVCSGEPTAMLAGPPTRERPCLWADFTRGEEDVIPRQCQGFVRFGPYDIWDEVVYQLLTAEERGSEERGSVEQKFIDAEIAYRLLRAVWTTSDVLEPFLEYDTRPAPDKFLEWLREANWRTGPQGETTDVMSWFAQLLRSRRARVPEGDLAKLSARAHEYVAAFQKAKGFELSDAIRKARDELQNAKMKATTKRGRIEVRMQMEPRMRALIRDFES